MLPTGFYAYPSVPDQLSETIETAINSINQKRVTRIEGWRTLNVGGKPVINEILNKIAASDLFLCDLTGLNPNVLFELGYAIAKRKRVWMTLDATKTQNVDQARTLPLVSSFGYRQHVNYQELRDRFMEDRPYDDIASHPLRPHDPLISKIERSARTNDVFYIPSSVESTASKMILNYLESLKMHNARKVVVYDHLEDSRDRWQWFLRNILEANSVIVHLDDPDSKDAPINNARCSFLAGLAIGFERNVRMIAPSPFDAPFDYREYLVDYKTGKQCRSSVAKWLGSIFITRLDRESPSHDSELALLEFHIGEPVAENEEAALSNYFVPTQAYSAGTRRTKMGIFVGRKGTGKTANLYQLRDFFSKERSNLVVTIKPVSFRIAVFGSLLRDFFPRADEAADFIERTWRAIIYAELALEVRRWIRCNTAFRDLTSHESTVVQHVEKYSDFVDVDFAGRIELIRNLIRKSVDAGNSPKAPLQTIARDFSGPLIRAYRSMFRRFQQVVILVDNLDKAWSVSDELGVQKRLIYGLLEFQNTIGRDLSSAKADVRLFVFLREDIFSNVIAEADEPDKVRLNVIRIAWSGTKLLNILERRFLYCSPELTTEAVWNDLFCRSVDRQTAKEYLLDHTLPRPRDLIHVVHSAIDNCVSRSSSRIESEDLRSAIKEYYQFLLDNMYTEYGVYMPVLRELIQAFSGTKVRQNGYEIWRTTRTYMRDGGGFSRIIEFLFRVSFIGIEQRTRGVKERTRVKYAFTNDEAKRLFPLVKSRLRWYSLPRIHFVIHPAFRAGLEMEEGR